MKVRRTEKIKVNTFRAGDVIRFKLSDGEKVEMLAVKEESDGMRITPAQAGKSLAVYLVRDGVGDHPRAGGEKEENQPGPNWELGSPPRRRGKAELHRERRAGSGITPAQAGKSAAVDAAAAARDHPRAGGEKLNGAFIDDFLTGSPPRRRGKVRALHCSSPVPGITPAQAGKRADGAGGGAALGDHPRAGGEKICGFTN